jgi:hypothetical protein
MVVSPSDLGGHQGDDLVEGVVGGDGSAGGAPEQDETESSGGASVSSRDQDATEPSEGFPPSEEGGEGVPGTAELAHQLVVGGMAVWPIACKAFESEEESLEEWVEVGLVEEVVVDVVDPRSVVGAWESVACVAHGAPPSWPGLAVVAGRCAHKERRSLCGTFPALYDVT